MSDRTFCSDAARLRGDDNTATAARIDVWLVVELCGPWGRNPLNDSALPPPVRETLVRAQAQLPRSRIVFIRRRAPGPYCRVVVARSNGNAGMAIRELASLEEVANVSFSELLDKTAPMATPLVLVCTHGQRDSCCGRRGYPLFDALRRREELDVWQCSHIGGDRFAANAVVLPWGLYYGPVEPHAADALADAIRRNEIFLPGYRGRSSLSRPVQAAETFVRRAAELLPLGALRFVRREQLGDGRTHVTLTDDKGTLHDVTLEQYVAGEVLLTCSVKTANSLPQFRLIDYRTS